MIEDVRLGRKQTANQRDVACPGGLFLLISRSEKRVALAISNPSSQNILIGLTKTLDATHGVVVTINQNPIVFNIAQHGALVTQEWYMWSAGPLVITVIESFLDDT